MRVDRIMKKAGIWFLLLGKRLFKRTFFVVLCVAVPILVLFLQKAYQTEEPGIRAVLYRPAGILSQEVCDMLLAYEGRVVFYEVGSQEQVQEEVRSGRADCGYLLEEDSLDKHITQYRKKDTKIANLVQETVFSQVFTVLSSHRYEDYMRKILNAEDAGPLIEASLEKYLHNNSTFCVEYVEGDSRPIPEKVKKTEFPVGRILLFFIYTAVLCGCIDAVKDREEKRFVKLGHPWMAEFTVIVLPFLVSVLVSVLCMVKVLGIERGMFSPGFWSACLAILALGCLLARCFRRYRTLMTSFVFLLLAGAVLCVV